MKKFNEMYVIGIDHGYGNMKTANCCFPTGVMKSYTEPAFVSDLLVWNGKYYSIGVGHKEFTADKFNDEDYYVLTLAAIARELRRERITDAAVFIAAGLPLTWVSEQKTDFKQYLLQHSEITFTFRNTEYRIKIVGAEIYPQGFAAVAEKLGDFKGVNMLCDIGNGTMNLLYLTDSQPQENRCWTEKIGVNQCMIRAKEAVLRRFGSKISDSTVEQVLRTGTAKIDVDYLACIREVAASYVAELFAALRSYEYDPATTHLTIVGGGGQLIKHFGSYDPEQFTIVDDICAAAKGYEYMAYRQMLRG